jgi:uncharacterized protein YciI
MLFLYQITPTRPEMPISPTEAEIAKVGEHFNFLKENHETGKVKIVGRTTAEPYIGLAVFEAENEEEAKHFAQKDPAVATGIFKVTVTPFSLIFS